MKYESALSRFVMSVWCINTGIVCSGYIRLDMLIILIKWHLPDIARGRLCHLPSSSLILLRIGGKCNAHREFGLAPIFIPRSVMLVFATESPKEFRECRLWGSNGLSGRISHLDTLILIKTWVCAKITEQSKYSAQLFHRVGHKQYYVIWKKGSLDSLLIYPYSLES